MPNQLLSSQVLLMSVLKDFFLLININFFNDLN